MTYEGLFLVGAVSQYLGASIAVGLFDEIDPGGVALLRVLGAAVIVIAVRRSWRRTWTRGELGSAAAFGIVLAAMNLSIYYAIDNLPLGTAVAIEFLGPISVAAIGVRSVRNGLALVIAIAGVAFLAEVQPEGSAKGVFFALLAGAMWAGYIVLGQRVARTGAAIDGLGVGMLCGALAISVFGIPHLGPAFDRPWLLAAALATGLLSNAIPYGIDQVVFRHIARARYALLQALLPVTAAVIGLVILGQEPTTNEIIGMGLVIAALALQTRPVETAVGP